MNNQVSRKNGITKIRLGNIQIVTKDINRWACGQLKKMPVVRSHNVLWAYKVSKQKKN